MNASTSTYKQWETQTGNISLLSATEADIERRYEDVRFNVISVMWGWVGVKFPGKNFT